MSHACPRPGCDRRVSDDMFACRPDWFALPEPVRRRIWQTWTTGDEGVHLAAMADAIEWYREHPPRRPRATRTAGETGDPR